MFNQSFVSYKTILSSSVLNVLFSSAMSLFPVLYVHVSNTTLFRQAEVNSVLRVNEAESFNEASEVRTDYLHHCL